MDNNLDNNSIPLNGDMFSNQPNGDIKNRKNPYFYLFIAAAVLLAIDLLLLILFGYNYTINKRDDSGEFDVSKGSWVEYEKDGGYIYDFSKNTCNVYFVAPGKDTETMQEGLEYSVLGNYVSIKKSGEEYKGFFYDSEFDCLWDYKESGNTTIRVKLLHFKDLPNDEQNTRNIKGYTYLQYSSSTAGLKGSGELATTAEPYGEKKSTTVDLSACKTAYRDYLLKCLKEHYFDEYDNTMPSFSEYMRFGFFYLDNDDIPELWCVNGIGAHGPGYDILTYKDGRVIKITSDANYLSYYEKEGVFAFTGFDMQFNIIVFYRMTENGCETLDGFESGYAVNEGVYKRNGLEISKEEYDGLLSGYDRGFGKLKSIDTYDGYIINEESIRANCK